jgi:hypothetical protein
MKITSFETSAALAWRMHPFLAVAGADANSFPNATGGTSMKTMQYTLVALAALFGTSCVDTVGEGTVISGLDDVPLIGDDATSPGKDAVSEPDETVTQPQTYPCTLDRDCAALGNTCADYLCRDAVCTAIPRGEERQCDDGNPCTIDTHCHSGECTGTHVCTNVVTPPNFFPIPPFPLH